MPEPISADKALDEIEQYAALLAVYTSPSSAAAELRRIASDLEEIQPGTN